MQLHELIFLDQQWKVYPSDGMNLRVFSFRSNITFGGEAQFPARRGLQPDYNRNFVIAGP